MTKNLIGRCGFYCGVCEVYRAYKDSRELQEKLAKKYNCSPEEVRCEGCQAMDIYGWAHEKEWGANCKILKCLTTQGLTFCFECTEYDNCQQHSQFASVCLKLGMDLKRNLQIIQKGESSEWLLEQDKKWRCPKCGNRIIVSFYLKNCHWCGNRLRE